MTELGKAWGEGEEAPPKGSPEQARLLELVTSFRSLLSFFLAEDTDCSR